MIQNTVKHIIAEISNVEFCEISEHDQLRNIGIDSLRSVELIIAIEDKLNITFDDSELNMENLNTVGTLIDLVGRLSKCA